MTEYVILKREDIPRKVPDGLEEHIPTALESWIVNDESVYASSPRRALVAAGVEEGEYVAIPVRSWKPLKVKVEQTTKIKIG